MMGDHFVTNCPELMSCSLQYDNLYDRVSSGTRFFGKASSAMTKIISKANGERDFRMTELQLFLETQDLIGMMDSLNRVGVHELKDLKALDVDQLRRVLECDGETFTAEEEALLSWRQVERFQKLTLHTVSMEELTGFDDPREHHVFLSHFKMEAGTDAALIRHELVEALNETQDCANLKVPVFLDSEDLQSLQDLMGRVKMSRNLAILLTDHVLTRPWVLAEIVTAVRNGVRVLPVHLLRLGNGFRFPDESFYTALRTGTLIPSEDMRLLYELSIDERMVEQCLRYVFRRISLSYSPHRAASIRSAELRAFIRQCQSRRKKPPLIIRRQLSSAPRCSMHAGGQGCPGGHELLLSTTADGNCQACHKWVSQGTEVLFCRPCLWVTCRSCAAEIGLKSAQEMVQMLEMHRDNEKARDRESEKVLETRRSL
jgi:hypothetical protein